MMMFTKQATPSKMEVVQELGMTDFDRLQSMPPQVNKP